MRPLAAVVAVAVAGAALVAAPAANGADWEPPAFERSISGTGLAPLYAWGVQHNPVTDEVLVGDYFNYKVRRFDTDGNLLGSFGRPASERQGQPYSLAVDPRDGSIYVPEISDGQGFGWVAKYDAEGELLFAFNTGARYNAWVATDDDGYFYVADSHYWNDAGSPPRIRRYRVNDATRSATQVGSFGRFGTDPGELNMVRGIAVAGNGDVYVADGGNNVVTHFDRDGDHVRTLTGPFAGDLRGITLDEARGNLWVVDANGSQLERFDLASGEHTGTFGGGNGSGPAQFADGGRQIDVTSDGELWVADYGNFRVHRYTPEGEFVAAYPSDGSDAPDGLVSKLRDVSVGPDGSVWLVDVWNHRFQRFAADGSHLGTWGRRGSAAPYGMNYPRGIGVDPATSHVWVANTRSHQLRVYDEQQRHLFDVGTGEDSNRQGSFRWPLDVDFAGGTAVVADYIGNRVKGIRTSDGRELWSVVSRNVHGVAVDEAANRFYAVGQAHDVVYVHRLSDGRELGTIGGPGTGPGRFQRPWDIELADGRLYVTDAARNKVIVYATNGTFLGELGSTGGGPGQLRSPSGLAAADGRLYVADSGNFRIQVFRLDGSASGDGQPPSLTVATPTPGGTVPPGPVELTGTAVDPDGVGAVEVMVRDRDTGESWHAVTSTWDETGRWAVAALAGEDPTRQEFRWVLPSVRPGHTYVARFRTHDAAGAVDSAPLPTRTFTVAETAGPVDEEPPVVDLGSPTPREVFDDRPVRVSGTATDDTGVAAVQVAVRDRDTGLWWDAEAGAWGAHRFQDAVVADAGADTTDWSFDFDDSASPGSGGYYVGVRAVDAAGRVGDSTGTRFDVADATTDVTAPEVVLTAPQNGTDVLDGRPATLAGTASDDTGVVAVEVAVKDQAGTTWWDAPAGTWGPYRWHEAELADPGAAATGWTFEFDDTGDQGSGGYFVRVRSRDAAGNVSEVTGRRFAVG
jgi:DNA-binding beta-propeller fold protein YncE